MIFEQFYLGCLAHASYLVGSEGIAAIIEPAFWLGQPRTNAGTFIDYFNSLLGWERFRASQFGIRHFCTIGLNPKEANNPKLAAVRESWQSGNPVDWVKIHQVPDFAYFNHSVHVNRGISCVSCHGQVNHMDVVYQKEPLSMGWCLNCHRHPENNLRPVSQVFNLDWKPGTGQSQEQFGLDLKKQWNINPPQTCEGCHR